MQKTSAYFSALLASATLLSRLSGQIRTILLVWAIGATGIVADAFDIANNIPTSLNLILTSGIFNAILVPQFVKAKRFKDGDARINKLLSVSISTLFVLSILLIIGTSVAINLIASPSWSDQQMQLATLFGYICMPQVFFYGLYTLLGQVLVAKEKFGLYGFAPVFNNLVSIIVLATYIFLTNSITNTSSTDLNFGVQNPDTLATWQIALLGGGTTFGILVQALLLIIPLMRDKFKFQFDLKLKGLGMRELAGVAIWSFGTIVVEQIAALWLVRAISGVPNRAVEYFGVPPEQAQAIAGNAVWTNSLIIYIVPQSLITVSLATALFAKISRAAVEGRREDVMREFVQGANINTVIVNFFSYAFIVLSVPIVRVLIPSASIQATVAIGIGVAALGTKLVASGICQMSTRVFFAYGKTKWFFFIDLPEHILLILLANFVVNTFPAVLMILGIALCTSLTMWLGAFACVEVIKHKILHVQGRTIWSVVGKTTLAGIASALIGWITLTLTAGTFNPEILTQQSWFHNLFSCVVVTATMGGTYVVSCHLLKVQEMNMLLNRLRARFKPKLQRNS
jgi:putative peptidoglycan lipid II flippase